MRTLLLLLGCLTLTACASSPPGGEDAADADGFVGTWTSTIDDTPYELRIVKSGTIVIRDLEDEQAYAGRWTRGADGTIAVAFEEDPDDSPDRGELLGPDELLLSGNGEGGIFTRALTATEAVSEVAPCPLRQRSGAGRGAGGRAPTECRQVLTGVLTGNTPLVCRSAQVFGVVHRPRRCTR